MNRTWSKYGIHSINHFAIAVPDISTVQHFTENFGLSLSPKGHYWALSARDAHEWARISEAKQKQTLYISLNCYPEDFAGLQSQILANGGTAHPPCETGPQDGFWFTDPHDQLFHLQAGSKTMPDSKSQPVPLPTKPGVAAAPTRTQVQRVQPIRLAHLLLFTPCVNTSVAFFEQALGLLVADRSGDGVAFMYARYGCDHHLLALAKSTGIGLHHSSWDVANINEIGVGAEHMRNNGYPHQWGLGRHVLGSNYFNYIQDADGFWWEYNVEIDYVPAGTTWASGDYRPEESLYLWGPVLPEDFIDNTENPGVS